MALPSQFYLFFIKCAGLSPARSTIPARAGTTAASPATHPADSRATAMGKSQRQFAFYILAAAFIAVDRLIGLVE